MLLLLLLASKLLLIFFFCCIYLMDSNKLMLNTDKTEVMIVGTASRIKQVAGNSIIILNSDIKIQESVKYLGVRLDQTLSMSSHISDVCRSSFLSLERISCIRPYLSDRATSCLVNSIVTSRLDFCNSSLTGITTDQLNDCGMGWFQVDFSRKGHMSRPWKLIF